MLWGKICRASAHNPPQHTHTHTRSLAHPTQEDGGERSNIISGNLGILAAAGTGNLVASEKDFPATFWWMNPSNSVAAGSTGPGFMWDLSWEMLTRWG